MSNTEKETQIQRIMKGIPCGRAEAEEIYAYDLKVNSMTTRQEIQSDLTPEQQAVVKKMKQAERKKTVYKFSTREKKKDTAKEDIISALVRFVENEICEGSCIVENPSRKFQFELGGDTYDITLTRKNKKKGEG